MTDGDRARLLAHLETIQAAFSKIATDALAVEAQRDRYKQALIQIACLDDTGANQRLEATGSYSAFDEPGSVQIAREELAADIQAGADIQGPKISERSAADIRALDIAGLREKAEAASGGPWTAQVYIDLRQGTAVVDSWPGHMWIEGVGGNLADDVEPQDAAFIAAFNPATALALLSRIESDAATIAALRRELGACGESGLFFEKEAWDQGARAEAAEAEVARLKEALRALALTTSEGKEIASALQPKAPDHAR